MRQLTLCLFAIWTSLASVAQANDSPVVVELFTSQGCSSCPPADALLAELGHRDDIIPLALHVDYWDYIGWKDAFAQPAFTKRQKGYARANGWRNIYTPQIVVNGVAHTVGSRPMKVADLIAKHAKHKSHATVTLVRSGNSVRIRVDADGTVRPCDIHVVRYDTAQEIDIHRGENAGKRFTYTHIARNWETVGRWDGKGSFQATVPLKGDAPLVVLVQEPRYGPIVAAARLR